ncbi:MAG TPA: glycoside hydrolase, partial [Candidatus Hydrogenedentes bacterium]|nr:glycoside hydrolase [Candidatus Hydrogenedentota bacterium]
MLVSLALCSPVGATVVEPEMYYTDTSYGRAFAKDPDVVRFKGAYYLYYSIMRPDGLAAGIARSDDLTHWEKVGEVTPASPCEKKGLGAPSAIVMGDTVHLFYQTYGNRQKDAICHAVSRNGIDFERNPDNPIFAPKGHWTAGRA